MRVCPYCASWIPDVAITCRFCGREVTPLSNARREPQGSAPAPGRVFTLFLLLILLVFLGVALLYAYKAYG